MGNEVKYDAKYKAGDVLYEIKTDNIWVVLAQSIGWLGCYRIANDNGSEVMTFEVVEGDCYKIGEL